MTAAEKYDRLKLERDVIHKELTELREKCGVWARHLVLLETVDEQDERILAYILNELAAEAAKLNL